jgi:hypothetical protein
MLNEIAREEIPQAVLEVLIERVELLIGLFKTYDLPILYSTMHLEKEAELREIVALLLKVHRQSVFTRLNQNSHPRSISLSSPFSPLS